MGTAHFPYPGVTLTHGPDRTHAHHYHSHSAERGEHLWFLYGNHEQTQRHKRHPKNNEPIAVWLVLCHGRNLEVQQWLTEESTGDSVELYDCVPIEVKGRLRGQE